MITARHFLVTREVEPGGNKKTRASAETDALGPEHRILDFLLGHDAPNRGQHFSSCRPLLVDLALLSYF